MRSKTTDLICEVVGEVGDCAPEKTVFVTSTTFDGDLSGLDGADAICQGLADAAGIGGTRIYMAWLADDTGSPDTRFTKATAPYVRTDGVKVANDYADLTTCADVNTCLQAPIDHDEWGDEVERVHSDTWTNVATDGTTSVDPQAMEHCNQWTSNDDITDGTYGNFVIAGEGWTFNGGLLCLYSNGLYCFEQ